MEWHPIETAPKDGSSFLVCVGNWMTVAHWHRPQQCLATNGPIYARYPADELPTHWMQLPEPPNAEELERELMVSVPREIDRSKHGSVLLVWNDCMIAHETLEMTWPKLVDAMLAAETRLSTGLERS